VKGAFRFSKKERISLPQDFKSVMKSGRRFHSKHFILFLKENGRGFNRLGIVAKKEIGPASLRNRLKRHLREFFRLNKDYIQGSYDIIILIKRGSLPGPYRETEEELRKALL
jgi:ribonuclease P protein component